MLIFSWLNLVVAILAVLERLPLYQSGLVAAATLPPKQGSWSQAAACGVGRFLGRFQGCQLVHIHHKIKRGFLTVFCIRNVHDRQRFKDGVCGVFLFSWEKELGGENRRVFRGSHLYVNMGGAEHVL